MRPVLTLTNFIRYVASYYTIMSIHCLYLLVLVVSQRGGVHPGQVTSPSQGNTHKHTVGRTINLSIMFLDCERKPCMGRTCKLHPERSRTFLPEGDRATNCAPMQPKDYNMQSEY
ncbi:hypothetical protein XENORESO_001381 [Xenotaenia resolanae]|uniref:Secreted protein n=1 Tax=Xenotaenia resolanae TaxID=208358 RepID=A0ABV0WLS1_9TELE